MRIGTSHIWIGDDLSNLTQATTEPIYTGGFIDLDQPVKGRYVVLRRHALFTG